MNVSPIIFAGLATVLLSGCYATVPPIAQGGPRDDASVTPYFDNQVKQRFPVGSDEAQLRAELHRESFKIRETNDPNLGYKYVATFEDSGICKALWTVRWNTDQEKITVTRTIRTSDVPYEKSAPTSKPRMRAAGGARLAY